MKDNYLESIILIKKKNKIIFKGLRKEFRDKYLEICSDFRIEVWCKQYGYKLWINEEEIPILNFYNFSLDYSL